MRIQILPLPSVVVGDDVKEPFGLIVDQCDTNAVDASEWTRFAEECGACSILITPETVDVVDRYAEAPEAAQHVIETDPHIWVKKALDADPRAVIAEINAYADAILNDIDEHGLEAVQRGDNGGYEPAVVSE